MDVVLDIACAWSFVGHERLRRTVANRRSRGDDIEVTYQPFQIVPGAPVVGERLAVVHQRVFGREAVGNDARMAATAAADGLRIDVDKAVFVNTYRAHLLIAHAAGQRLAEPTVARLFTAYFTDGYDVGDPDALVLLGESVGVAVSADDLFSIQGAKQLDANLKDVRRRGVTTVPMFRVGRLPWVAGCLTQSELEDEFDSARSDS